MKIMQTLGTYLSTLVTEHLFLDKAGSSLPNKQSSHFRIILK